MLEGGQAWLHATGSWVADPMPPCCGCRPTLQASVPTWLYCGTPHGACIPVNLHVGVRTGLAACYRLVGSRSHAALPRMPPYAISVCSNMAILWYAEWSMQCIPAYSSCLRRTKTDTCCWLVCSRPHAVPLRLVCAISHRDWHTSIAIYYALLNFVWFLLLRYSNSCLIYFYQQLNPRQLNSK